MIRHTSVPTPSRITLLLILLLAIGLTGCDLPTEEVAPGMAQTATPAADTSAPAPTTQVGLPGEATAAVPVNEQPVQEAGPSPLPTEASASTSPGEGGAPRTYVVKAGDTLSQIAEQFDVSVAELMAANNISIADFLQIDQVLTIPAPGSIALLPTQAPSVAPTSATVAEVLPTQTKITPPRPTQTKVAAVAPSQPTRRPTQAASIPPTPTSEPVVAVAPTATQVVVVEAPTATAVPPVVSERQPVVVNGRTYDAYNEAAIKRGQWYQYTCEFDAAWIVLKTYGIDTTLDDLINAVGLDTSIEPYYKETKDGVVVYGGDIVNFYSGNYRKNFLARSTGQAMRKAFEEYGLQVTAVRDRESLEAALLRGELVWIKTTVDFKPWVPVTWIMPDGSRTKGVLGNDHALVVMGFNKDGVLISDPLGPTSTGRNRPFQYEVTWAKFMAAWGAQNNDGLAVAPPGR